MNKTYTITLYLENGDINAVVARGVKFEEIFTTILNNIHFHYPDWKWGDGNNNCIQAYFCSDQKTHITINGVGDVWKGDTYYVIEEDTE